MMSLLASTAERSGAVAAGGVSDSRISQLLHVSVSAASSDVAENLGFPLAGWHDHPVPVLRQAGADQEELSPLCTPVLWVLAVLQRQADALGVRARGLCICSCSTSWARYSRSQSLASSSLPPSAWRGHPQPCVGLERCVIPFKWLLHGKHES